MTKINLQEILDSIIARQNHDIYKGLVAAVKSVEVDTSAIDPKYVNAVVHGFHQALRKAEANMEEYYKESQK